MSNAFTQMKKNSGSLSEKINAKLDSQSANQYGDDRYWKPTRDKAGNGYAVVRFLPAPEGEEDSFQQYWDHGFKGPTGQWYIENSLTTLGQDDPCSEYNSKLWALGKDDDSKERAQARKQKRRLHYVSNVFVVEDPDHPENEGKVFLFKYGVKIMNKIEKALRPQLTEAQKKSKKEIKLPDAFNPFDLWDGADFTLNIKKVEGYPNYDDSEFEAPAAVGSSDKEREVIWKSEFSLTEIVDPKNFKSYNELKAKLNRVLDIDAGEAAPSIQDTMESTDAGSSQSEGESNLDSTPPWSENDSTESTDSDLDTDDFFDNLDKD